MWDVLPLPRWLPRPAFIRAKPAQQIFREEVRRLLERRRARLAAGQAVPDDLVTRLMEARDPETSVPLSDAVIHDNLVTFIGAGIAITGTLAASEAADIAAFAGAIEAPPVLVGGGGYRALWRPPVIIGVGVGVLPELVGEAHGIVTAAGTAAAALQLAGAADGTISVGGLGAALLQIDVTARGDVVALGVGAGSIGFTGRAIGRADDDEAAVLAWLLAA